MFFALTIVIYSLSNAYLALSKSANCPKGNTFPDSYCKALIAQNINRCLDQGNVYFKLVLCCQSCEETLVSPDPRWKGKDCSDQYDVSVCKSIVNGQRIWKCNGFGIAMCRKSCGACPATKAPIPSSTTTSPGVDCSCGCTPIEPIGEIKGIIGGDQAEPYSWPWQVWVTYDKPNNKISTCGGSIIGDKWILTAAHCLDLSLTKPMNEYTVYAALYNTQQAWTGEAQKYSVAQVIRNPKWTGLSSPHGDDIALIKLTTSVLYGDRVQKVCLPKTDSAETVVGTRFTVTGYGSTSVDKNSPHNTILNQLTFYTVGKVGSLTCKNEEICGLGPKSGSSAFHGDSGGPLVRKRNNNWYQFGVVSGSTRNKAGDELAVFVRISRHCEWIKEVTGVNICR